MHTGLKHSQKEKAVNSAPLTQLTVSEASSLLKLPSQKYTVMHQQGCTSSLVPSCTPTLCTLDGLRLQRGRLPMEFWLAPLPPPLPSVAVPGSDVGFNFAEEGVWL